MTPAEIEKTRRLKAVQIKQSRVEANINKIDLSRVSGLSRDTIDAIECGERAWSIDTEILYRNGVAQITEIKKRVKRN